MRDDDHSSSDLVWTAVVVALFAIAGLLGLASAAGASAYRPTRTDDPAPNGCKLQDCSLREAIDKANSHPGLDTIVLRGGKTYRLGLDNTAGDEDLNATGDFDVLESLVVKSSTKKQATVNGDGIDRVFEIGPSSPVSATFQRIVIRNGHSVASASGGGIQSFNGGLLRLVHSQVIGNTASGEGGGISADGGTLKVVRSVIARNFAAGGNAGAIEGEPNLGTEIISISRSQIVGNRASEGVGGVYSYEDATITNSTIANNHAQGGEGGGLYNGEGTLTVKNSTISGNTATTTGGGMENDGTATLVNDTISGNHSGTQGGGLYGYGATSLNGVTVARNSAGTDGGGIYGGNGTMDVANSLIALNTKGSGVGPDCLALSPGTIVSGGHNLIGTAADCGAVFLGHHDIHDVNPKIGKLADNGGPTKTIALKHGSKAIDHAGSSAPSRDQRGFKRHDPDSGAFEFGSGH
jgi:predicted outer membrane repeat protein